MDSFVTPLDPLPFAFELLRGGHLTACEVEPVVAVALALDILLRGGHWATSRGCLPRVG